MTLNLAGLEGDLRGDPVADVRRVALAPGDVLAVLLPAGAIVSAEGVGRVRDAIRAELRAAGIHNRIMIVTGGIDLAAVAPTPLP